MIYAEKAREISPQELEHQLKAKPTNITVPGIEKFVPPPPPVFEVDWARRSVASLALLFLVSIVCWLSLSNRTTWFWLPFLLSTIGSGIGMVYEGWLLAKNQPYQLFGSMCGLRVQILRAAVFGMLIGSVSFWYSQLTFGVYDQSVLLLAFCAFLTGWLLVCLLFEAPQHNVLFVMGLFLVLELSCLLISSPIAGGWLVKCVLGLAAIGIFAGSVVGSATPKKSTIFHCIAAASVLLMALCGWQQPTESVRRLSSLSWLLVIGSIWIGTLGAFRWLPSTWARFRSLLANWTWPLFYLIVAGGQRLPRPTSLGELYKGDEEKLKPLALHRYHIAHSRNLTHPIQIPCLDEALTLKVHKFGLLGELVKFIFAVGSLFNRVFPFANMEVPIRQKPRMLPWSDGSEYWPWWLLQEVKLPDIGRFKNLGTFKIESGVQGPGFQRTPKEAIDAYQQGQLLAYMVEYGIAGSFLRAEQIHGRIRFCLDLSFLEKYETKRDYESYGGFAYFEIDDASKSLRLISVRAPHSQVEVAADINDPVFRHAESMILASIYFYVVSGKHLVEIHMGLNLVEIALFNAFDANQQWFHPIRVAMYPHLFAHELAEELTTENLLEDNAIFPQIFATTNASLARYLNDRFAEYQLGRDEDFDEREAILLTGRHGTTLEETLPNCSLIWENRYAALWNEYASSLINATYESDEALRNDEFVMQFASNLDAFFQQPLADKYEKLSTRLGLTRLISDTMHHLIIRHEVYGTSGVRLALDPRINQVQVPKDGGPPAIDEWRSLACIAMATSRVRYVKLMGGFKYLFQDLKQANVRQQFDEAHDRLQESLLQLEKDFKAEGIDDYGRLRPLPSELDIGAGY
ncbi:MAG: hypothetical protein NTU79_00490 [Planctomycetota bacterium]|nr:hypothetical protein [Planctomycetota bacterium]